MPGPHILKPRLKLFDWVTQVQAFTYLSREKEKEIIYVYGVYMYI